MRTRPAVTFVAVLISITICTTPSRAAPAPEATKTPAPIAGPEKQVTLTARRPAGGRGRWFAAFEEQTLAAGGADKALGPSSRGAADVDCGGARFRIARFSAFAGPNFTGAVLLDLSRRTAWRSPEPGTTMARVLAAVCAPVEVRAARTRPPAAVDPPAPPAPPAPEPHAPDEAHETPAPPDAAAAAGPAFYAQLASLPSADAARQTWAALERAAPGLLDQRLRRLTVAMVHGRRAYRVLAGGFGTKDQAERVCKALARLSAGCFVRPGGAA